MRTVDIYTDGACSGNPGPGGWAAILIYEGVEKELSGFVMDTTNQRMELQAAIAGLTALKEPCTIKLNSDSAYLVNAFQQDWFAKWERNGWRNSGKKPVSNMDLWLKLQELNQRHQITWVKVPGHRDNLYNNRCDELARTAILAGKAER
jgi:ribonuclease HI